MADGVWEVQPNAVKREFLKHFQDRFAKPMECRAIIDMCYPNTITGEQRADLEREVTIEEIKTVDFEKAYDSVRWDFLEDVLKKFGFGNKWCNWILCCLNSSKGSILVNGSPTEEFQFYKGLKQGDPLSPFLFILVIESLHLSFQWVVDTGMFKGLTLNDSLCLSHMFYADDAIFVGQWSVGNITTLLHVLDCFYHASGLKINLRKSKIMGVNVDYSYVNQAAVKLGCQILDTPFMYLGTKVGGNMSRVQAWQEVVEKVKARLSKWKMNTLSIGGRLTLLKYVLRSIPIFHMSIFKVPSKILQLLESIRGRFFM
ncbi:RNA-directed DNA polymerase, eukaryota, reverse transcriptase zinc-binding domain protein [Tanacetum coccineum]